MQRYKELDGLRGIWALLVVMVHARVPRTWALFFFMDGFFALSALVIASSLVHSEQKPVRQRLLNFFQRRAARVLPGYYFTVVLGIMSAVLINFILIKLGRQPIFEIENIWHYLLFIQNVPKYWQNAGDYHDISLLGHLWSLAIEEQFYLFIGTLWIAFRSSRWRICLSMGCISLGVVSRCLKMDGTLTAYHMDALGYGLAGALLLTQSKILFERCPILVSIIGFITIGAFAAYVAATFWKVGSLENLSNYEWSWTRASLASSLGCGTLVLWISLRSGKTYLGFLRHPISQYLGRTSYALYLIHFLISNVAIRCGIVKNPNLLNEVSIVILSLGCAHIFTIQLEKWQRSINKWQLG